MWYLKSNTGQLIYLKTNKELVFGRKKGDIICAEDKSISRLHASICVEQKKRIDLGKPTSTCKLKDFDTKYGTFVLKGDETITVMGEEYMLQDQDKIQIGLQDYIYTIRYVPIVTVISSLSQDDSKKLQSLMDEIDGVVTNDWISNCTHLTVSKATLTEKVVCAMASAVPAVDINYWEHVKLAFDNGGKMPDPNDFVLDLDESLIMKGIKLSVNEKRKTLFEKFIFVFFNKRQCRQYEKMIRLAGGQLILFTKKPLSEKQLCAANVIIVQYSGNDETQSTQSLVPEYETIYKTLEANNRRMISDNEIPVAILQCSMNTHCNPKFKFKELLRRSGAKLYSSAVLAPDTHDMLCDAGAQPKIISDVPVKTNLINKISKTTAKIIPETCDSFSNVNSLSNFSVDSQIKAPPTISADYIPETIDSLSRTALDSQKSQHTIKKLSPNNTCDYIPETIDTLSRTALSNQKGQHTIQKLNPPGNRCNYIPETIDSDSEPDPVVKKVTEISLDDTRNLKQQLMEKDVERAESSNRIIPDTITQSSDRIELDIEKYLRSQRKQNSVKGDNSNEVVTSEISEKLSKAPDVIEINMEDDNTFEPPMISKSKTNHTKISNIRRQTPAMDNQMLKTTNRNNDWDESNDNVQLSESTRKGTSNKDSIMREHLASAPDTMTQSSNIIELDIEKYLRSQRERNSVKADNSSEVVTFEISEKLSKAPDVIEINMEDDNTFEPPMIRKPKANHTKISNIRRQTPAMDNEKLKTTNRDNDSDESNDNVQFSESTTKGTSSKGSIERELSTIVTSISRKANSNPDTSEDLNNCDTSHNSSNRDTAENSSNRDTSEKPRSSFLRATVGHKRFQKVYNMIPAKRITLADMYVAQK